MKDDWIHKVLMLPWMLPLSSHIGSLWLRVSPLESIWLSIGSALTLSLSSAVCTIYTVTLITIYTNGSSRPLSPAHPHTQLDDSLGNNRLQKVMAPTAIAGYGR